MTPSRLGNRSVSTDSDLGQSNPEFSAPQPLGFRQRNIRYFSFLHFRVFPRLPVQVWSQKSHSCTHHLFLSKVFLDYLVQYLPISVAYIREMPDLSLTVKVRLKNYFTFPCDVQEFLSTTCYYRLYHCP